MPIVRALGVHEPAGHLARRVQQKRKRTRRVVFEDPEIRVVDARVDRQFRQVAAHEREVMQHVEPADFANPVERGLVADVAAERVRRVRRIHDDAAAANDVGCLREQSALRMRRMDGEVLAHGGFMK